MVILLGGQSRDFWDKTVVRVSSQRSRVHKSTDFRLAPRCVSTLLAFLLFITILVATERFVTIGV